MRIVTQFDGAALQRMGRALSELSEFDGRRALARTLNHEADKGRTQVKRELVRQTGIKYRQIDGAMTTRRASAYRLEYAMEQAGDETNISVFGSKRLKKGIKASPWNRARLFASAFQVQQFGGRVYRRRFAEGGGRVPRGPLAPLFGPNPAREIIKGDTAKAFYDIGPAVEKRVLHEVARILGGAR